MPFISISIGMVTSLSISSGEWPGHWVINSTWGGERSGYASIGSLLKEYAPQNISARAATTITNGCVSAKEPMRAIMMSRLTAFGSRIEGRYRHR